jgi:hypothetical protein
LFDDLFDDAVTLFPLERSRANEMGPVICSNRVRYPPPNHPVGIRIGHCWTGVTRLPG